MDQFQKQLDNNEFQEIGSMASFKVLETQFQMFIKSNIYLNDEYIVMTRNYFLQYSQLDIPEFRETLVHFMEYVKNSIDERALHKRKHDSRVNERQNHKRRIQAADQGMMHMLMMQISDPYMMKSQMTENAAQCHDTCPLPAKFIDNQTTKLSNQSLEYENICLKKTVAQFQKDFLRMKAHCVNLELKYQNQALKEGQHGQFLKVKSNEAKIKHDIDVIETINIKLEHKVAKLLKENETLKRHYKELSDSIKTTRAKTIEHTTSLIAKKDEFKAQLQEKEFAIAALKNKLRKLSGNSSERPRISKPRFASQVDVNNDLSKPVTTHYLPKGKESACAKPHHMIAPGSSRYSLNDMVHNHYLEEAKKKTQKSDRNSRPSVMPSAKSQSTANGNKPKSRSNTQTSRNWPVSKNSFVTTKNVPIAEHSRNSRNFSDSKYFVCSTCQKCVFNANHVFVQLIPENEVNSRAKVVRLGVSPMIQPEQVRVLPQDTPSLKLQSLGQYDFVSPWLYSGGGIPFQLKSDSLPHAHAQRHTISIKVLKTKTSANSDKQDLPLKILKSIKGIVSKLLKDDAMFMMIVGKTQDRKVVGGQRRSILKD
ncbi:hypothetical protein Tco_0807614 [Tanacetum coccineum]